MNKTVFFLFSFTWAVQPVPGNLAHILFYKSYSCCCVCCTVFYKMHVDASVCVPINNCQAQSRTLQHWCIMFRAEAFWVVWNEILLKIRFVWNAFLSNVKWPRQTQSLLFFFCFFQNNGQNMRWSQTEGVKAKPALQRHRKWRREMRP